MLDCIYDSKELLKRIRNRSSLDDPEVFSTVINVMKDIRADGDKALRKYTEQFDKCIINDFLVSDIEIARAYDDIDESILEIIKESGENIREFHKKQKQDSWMWEKNSGMILGQRITAIDKAGVYIPGGTAPLISSVLMNAVPAAVAGVNEIIMCTPPDKDGRIDCNRIVAAVESGVSKIFKAGGAQAIFAMAFGTKSVPKVDKITGPGNIYVANAKKLAYGYCGIDMIAGPSEILIIADDEANPSFVAADLLSQAEHDILAASILITFSKEFADKVNAEVEKQLMVLPRKDIAEKSIKTHGAVYIAKTPNEAIKVVNEIAPEHCELMVSNPNDYINEITNAGAIFVGEYSPEPLGDYWAGPNHTLPTGGTAKFYSPLGVYDFYKRTSIINCDKNALKKDYKKIAAFARAEKLDAHANAINIRFSEDKDE